MGTTRKSPATSTFKVADLPTTSVQFRMASGGTGTPQATAYVQAVRSLAAWARGGTFAPVVHALVHLGWTSGTGARATVRAANSAAFKHGAPALKVGAPAAPQVVNILEALSAAGAPKDAIATVWKTFTGKA